jgi:Tfp pilus assembly protein PilF
VSPIPSIDPDQFVAWVQPLLAKQDLAGLTGLLRSHWTAEQLTQVLSEAHQDARKVAALALALVGTKCCIPKLAAQLKDPDPTTNQMAEHALWSIWSRCGREQAHQHLCRGSQALGRRDFEAAKHDFTAAIEADPSFAEAYNQRAIVEYLTEGYAQSIADCQKAVEYMPCHFGAWAGMGHCQAQLGQMREALESYRRALEINPHLEGIAEAVRQISRRCDDIGEVSI